MNASEMYTRWMYNRDVSTHFCVDKRITLTISPLSFTLHILPIWTHLSKTDVLVPERGKWRNGGLVGIVETEKAVGQEGRRGMFQFPRMHVVSTKDV